MKRLVVLFVFMLCGVNLYAQHSQTFNVLQVRTIETATKVDPKLYDVKLGWHHEVSVGKWSIDDSDVYAEALRVSYIFGNRLNDNLFLGVGVGLDLTQSDTSTLDIDDFRDYMFDCDYLNLPMQDVSIPLFANAKWYFSKRKLAPFVSVSAGVNISGEKTAKISGDEYNYGGSVGFYDVAVGVAINNKSGRTINVQIGSYGTILSTYSYRGGHDWSINQDTWYSGANLSVGMTF
jgi:hypothetical protein